MHGRKILRSLVEMMICDICLLSTEIRSAQPKGEIGGQIMYDITEKKAARETPDQSLASLISPLSDCSTFVMSALLSNPKATVVLVCI